MDSAPKFHLKMVGIEIDISQILCFFQFPVNIARYSLIV